MAATDSKGTAPSLSAFDIATHVESAQIQLAELTKLLFFCAAHADGSDRDDGESKFVGQVLALGRAIELELVCLRQAGACVYDMAGALGNKAGSISPDI